MKTTLPKELTTQQEVEKFIADLWANDEFYHLDDPAEDIVTIKDGERVFTDDEANQLNALVNQAFDICDVWGLPIIRTINEHINIRKDNHEHRNQRNKCHNEINEHILLQTFPPTHHHTTKHEDRGTGSWSGDGGARGERRGAARRGISTKNNSLCQRGEGEAERSGATSGAAMAGRRSYVADTLIRT